MKSSRIHQFLFFATMTIAAVVAPPLYSDDGILCIGRQFIGSFQTSGNTQVLSSDGQYLFRGSNRGLTTFAVDSDGSIVLVSDLDIGSVFDISIGNGIAYLGGNRTFYIVDVSDRSNPVVLYQHDVTILSPRVAHFDTNLFLFTGLEIIAFDAADPSSPVERWRLSGLNDSLPQSTVTNGTLLLTSGGNRIRTYDVSDPSGPQLLDSISTGSGPRKMQLIENYLVALDQAERCVILDISDPSNIVELSRMNLPDDALDLSLSGSQLQIATNHAGILCFDISDPEQPQFQGAYDAPNAVTILSRVGPYTFYGVTSTIFSLNLSDPRLSPEISRTPIDGEAWDVEARGNIVYAVDREHGYLDVYTILDPFNPLRLSRTLIPGPPQFIRIAGDRAYTTGRYGSLNLIDISKPRQPRVRSTVSADPGSFVTISGNFALLTGNDLSIYDVSDALSPFLVSSLNLPGPGHGTLVHNELAYIASGQMGIHIVDVSNANSPHLVTTFSTVAPAVDILENNGHLYVRGTSGFQVYSLSDPRNPSFVELVPSIGGGADFHIEQDICYLAHTTGGASLYDISDPVDARFLGNFDTVGEVRSVAPSGNLVVIADRYRGLYVVDSSDCPECPADMDGNEVIDTFDVLIYVQLYLSQDAEADLNEDGLWNFFDIVEFLDRYQLGCQ